MAKNKKNVENPQELENFENAVLTTEAFIEKNQKQLMLAFVAILVVMTAWLGYRNLYQIPNNQEAELLVYAGQDYFNNAKYDIALNGDSVDFVGFVAIADEYGNTPSGELANAYAGLSYYKLGDYDNAIDYLSNYSAGDDILGYSVVGTIGDSYVQKGDVQAALPYLKQAAQSGNIMIAATYSLKVARAYEFLGETAKALETYKFIEKEYKGVMPGMTDVDDVQKFINALSK
ncbi:MAG: tetratricopeptide repeat protein [Paludibacteraceae bacterium]|jgi:tetratricopeptide (TPR) repeat protein|nr:tetratricopeptide repeat protein [Paludibacteraceae bacterium]MED9996695.1 tetratricopeptide repeat protein [Paludibacteraceae bacterium]